jgi:hypothetical protein
VRAVTKNRILFYPLNNRIVINFVQMAHFPDGRPFFNPGGIAIGTYAPDDKSFHSILAFW